MRRGPDRKSEFLRALKDEGTGELTTGSSPGTSGEVTPVWMPSNAHSVCLSVCQATECSSYKKSFSQKVFLWETMKNRIVGLNSFDVKWIFCKISLLCHLFVICEGLYCMFMLLDLVGFVLFQYPPLRKKDVLSEFVLPLLTGWKHPGAQSLQWRGLSWERSVLLPQWLRHWTPVQLPGGRAPVGGYPPYSHTHVQLTCTQTEVIFISWQVTESNGLAGVPRKWRQLPASDGGRAERVPD